MADARLRRDVAWNMVPVALLAAIGLGTNFAIYRWWGGETLAVFNLVTTAFFVLAVIGAWGLQFAVLRAIAEAPEDRDRVASVVVGALVPNLVLAALVTIAFVALRAPFSRLHDSDAVGQGMLAATPGLFCFAINKTLFNVVNGLRRMRAFAVYTSLRYVLIGVGVVIAHVMSWHVAVVWSLVECTMIVVLAIEVVTQIDLRRAHDWRRWTRAHLEFGTRGVLATLAGEINSKLDIWVLGASGIDKALVGVYVIAGALSEGAMQLAVVLQNNLDPVLARDIGQPAEIEALARRTRRWFVPAFGAACLVGAFAFPILLPALMHDPLLHVGTVPFAILMAGLVVASPYLPFVQILLMAGKPAWHTVLVVSVLAVNGIADLVLIPRFGLDGAAVATALAAVSAAVLVRVLTRRLVNVKF
ncbi:MAG TPA: polysaccharide biosynthesis C-terminal domain-containing protein [Kofleriaceae bacterium]